MAASVRADRRRLEPLLAAVLVAALYLLVQPRSVDLAAHVYRAGLFGRQGLGVWDANWYAGHHTPGYSLTFPPVAWLLGAELAGVVGAIAAALLFERLAYGAFAERARLGALWFGAASGTLLFTGRLAFCAGVAVALAALLAFQRRRTSIAATLAVICGLTSPVAALFLALAGLTCALAGDRRRGAALVIGAAAPPLALAFAFPEGGYEPFAASQFWPLLALTLLALPLLPRTLRIGAFLYALATIAAFCVHTPMGGNAARLGELFAAPLLACTLRSSSMRGRLTVLLLIPLAWLQLAPAAKDVSKVAADPAVRASYYHPLLAELARRGGPPGRVEIPFTRGHWESAEVAPQLPLARGWERQLDIARNGLFYGHGPLAPGTYASWLSANAVRWVAVAAAVPDYSAESEIRLVASKLPYLILRWKSRDWKLYEFSGPHSLVVGEGQARIALNQLTPQRITLQVARAGPARVAVAWSPYWRVSQGCVERDGKWIRVRAGHPGPLSLEIRFSLVRVLDRGPRCP